MVTEIQFSRHHPITIQSTESLDFIVSQERERERERERIAAFKFKHFKTSYAMYITTNSAWIPRESKIWCYQTQSAISTQAHKNIPLLDDLNLGQFK